MRIESKLCHLSENKVVVQVDGWLNNKKLGSSLAEGPTVEIAEDKAISRLKERINGVTQNESNINSTQVDIIKKPKKIELLISDNKDKNTINKEPSDWSNELTAIDAEIERLKWSRDDEIDFLENTLGYNNRNKITNYSDLLKYLSLLKQIGNPIKSKVPNININDLIEESDSILRELSWDNAQGREYLQCEFNVSTRKELNETQLISFVEKLKSIRNQHLPY